MVLKQILCLNGQIGEDVLFLVVKVLKLVQEPVKAILAANNSLIVKTVTILIV